MRHLVMLILCVIGMDVICVTGKYSESVQNFGKHHLCQKHYQRKIFQRAILANACPSSYTKKNTRVENGFLMPFIVGALCKDTGGWLEKWVRKYVDVDEDQRISLKERFWFFHKH